MDDIAWIPHKDHRSNYLILTLPVIGTFCKILKRKDIVHKSLINIQFEYNQHCIRVMGGQL